ncbi:YkvA family protein [Paenibacillus allorhizosphaerae]|uniref:DUF1232 domain-containing protein n=1 Tax=Paenibacillus allorhizosphaerae TaxID=2849866 RepID=A0ABM8VGN8_9BACL|nr:YkvA family protein [Paenibacillus allorhizosphaerae]CAG7639166.1 hypothetical protein PAECIP111802_02514 [Paenibacillus allorhizosphaerae]
MDVNVKPEEKKPESLLHRLKTMAKKLKQNLMTIYLAYRDPRVSLFAKIFAVCVVAYAFSPVDLIPDFIPVLGYLDDVIIVPLGVYITLRLIPPEVLEEYRAAAEERRKLGKPINWFTGALIIGLWLCLAVAASMYLYKLFY